MANQAKRGLVVVSYVGCYLKVLSGCAARGEYLDGFVTPERSFIQASTKNELYAELPLGAARLSAEIAKGNEVRLEYVVVGERYAKSAPVEFEGACEGATHYVRSIMVGAYSLDATSNQTTGGGVSIVDVGGGARHEALRRRLAGAGDLELCQDKPKDMKCTAILRLGLAVLVRPEPTAVLGFGAVRAAPARMFTPVASAARAETSYEDLLAEAAAATAEAAAATAKVEAIKKAREDAAAAQRAKVQKARAARLARLEKARVARLARLERAWASVSKIMGTTALDKGRRAGAVQRFLSDYPNDNPHLKAAQAGLAALKRGKEPSGGRRGAATGALNWVYSRPAKLEMMRAEVTVAQYKGCVDAGKCKQDFQTKSDYDRCNWGYPGRGSHPMNCVYLNGADAFCGWAGDCLRSMSGSPRRPITRLASTHGVLNKRAVHGW